MRVSVLYLILAIRVAIAADWGPPVNGLRVSLAVEADTIVVTFENVGENREMFLPLGRAVAVGRAEFTHLNLILPNGTSRQLQYIGGSGVVPGRLLPFIVPMMVGSIYSVRTPLQHWRLGANLDPIEPELSQGASLQAEILAGDSLQWEYVNCYGLQIFWSGRAVSNVVRQ
jgi:hypothetical protein